MKIKDLKCLCGHLNEVHGGWEDGQEESYPTGCNYKTTYYTKKEYYICNCTEFKLDNLSVLEIAYDKKFNL